ncbi:MAG: cytochrome c-type biogenesis protein CcmH [Sphingopyxis sp.]|nr:cytochrome c-type biogenesis protein CcmH [Sphingopyxis sp.]
MIRHVTVMLAICVTLLFSAPPVLAQSALPPAPYAYQQLDDPALEERARVLMHELRCLVCQGQSIADSDAPLAGDMRSQVRERLLAGESPDAIRNWLIARYGAWVTYDPPLSAGTAILFVAPLFALVLGGWLTLRRIRFRRPGKQEGDSA